MKASKLIELLNQMKLIAGEDLEVTYYLNNLGFYESNITRIEAKLTEEKWNGEELIQEKLTEEQAIVIYIG